MNRFAILTAAILGMAGCARATPPAPSPLVPLQSDAPCARCTGYLLPGGHVPSPRAVYRIDSDLPELYTSNGVLYSTASVLPPFNTNKGEPVPEAMRTQRNAGFTTIDDSFEVFLYHLSQKHAPGETRRIVVHARNTGSQAVTVTPRQAVFHGPNAGNAGSVESRLGEAVLLEQWERPVSPVVIAPGQSAIIGYTKQLGSPSDGPDTTKAVFVTGILRADVAGTSPSLEVAVVSIPGSPEPAAMKELTEGLLGTGADSAETSMDLLIPPPQCHVRRVVGTAPNVLWQSEPFVLDAAALPADGVFFQMAKFSVQSVGCMDSRQSVDLLLHPPYVHPDSIGNYMMEYLLTLTLTNSGTEPRTVDLMYGKDDAPIGLAWQMVVAPEAASLEALQPLPVAIGWADKKRVENEPYYRATMLADGLLQLAPGEQKTVTMRLMVLGTSALPWQLHVVPQ